MEEMDDVATSSGSGSSDDRLLENEERDFESPFLPDSRAEEESLQERITRARRARKNAEERVRQRYGRVEDTSGDRRWRVNDHRVLRSEKPSVL